ncbi:MAG: acylphosphatase [Reichenbachiella sp.]
MDEVIGRSILVSGRVQGVFYRASTVAEAKKLNLKGWVKNLSNGDVLIEVFGSPKNIKVLINWCKQGPPLSEVADIKIQEIPLREENEFKVAY